MSAVPQQDQLTAGVSVLSGRLNTATWRARLTNTGQVYSARSDWSAVSADTFTGRRYMSGIRFRSVLGAEETTKAVCYVQLYSTV